MIAIAVHPVLFARWRHFLFLSVPIAAIAALGAGTAARLAGPRAWLVAGAIVLALASVGASMYRLHPYPFLYVNPIAGGLPGIEGRYELDYWGRSYREATAWVRSRVETKREGAVSVFVCGPEQAAAAWFSKDMTLAKRIDEADYVICFTRAGHPSPARMPDHVVQRQGVTLSRVWAMRRGD